LTNLDNVDDGLGFFKGFQVILFVATCIFHIMIVVVYNSPNDPKNRHEAFHGHLKCLSYYIFFGSSFFITHSSQMFSKYLWNAFENGKKFNFLILFLNRYLKCAIPMIFIIIIDELIVKNWIATFVQTPMYYPQKDTNYFLPLTFIQNYIWNLKDYVII
jgi:hypothetical protein